MKSIRALLASMTGQMFVLLLGGMLAAALVAGITSYLNSSRELKRLADERAADRLQGFVAFLDAAPPEFRARLLRRNGSGIVSQPQSVAGIGPDPDFSHVLSLRDGVVQGAEAQKADPSLCMQSMGGRPGPPPRFRGFDGPPPDLPPEAASLRPDPMAAAAPFAPASCRLVSLRLTDGTPLRLSVETPWVQPVETRLLDPAFMILLGAGVVVLAWFAAVRASAPLRRLAQASTQLGQDLHREPLAVTGPSEVRQAVSAFNAMQARLQSYLAERTQMLAAITHDLQTPLTRLRLRLERVEDADLRERLIGDMQAMRALIDEGLELARTAETPEAIVMLDLDSVLESLVEDAADAGLKARFTGGCGAVLPLRPLATRRVFANLIDNALVHGGSASVNAVRDSDCVSVFVRDHGPGIPEDLLERAFDPFFRTENSRSRETGGTGLGLTIARMLAAKIGATLTLRNHPQGGLEARVAWRLSDLDLPQH